MRLRMTSWWIFIFLGLIALLPHVPAAQSIGSLIAYIDQGGNLYVSEPDGSRRRQLASGDMLQQIAFSPTQFTRKRSFYSWPTWSPDGRLLACFRFFSAEDTPQDSLYVFDVATTQVLNFYNEPNLQPIYAFWAPNSDQLAVLRGGPSPAFSLDLWSVSSRGRLKTVARGKPFYFDWRADSQALLVHTTDDPEVTKKHSVSLLTLDSGRRHVISLAPSAFGAPSWSADGQWLAYGQDGQKDRKGTLMAAGADGQDAKSLGVIPRRMAMQWSPTQALLAVATAAEDQYLFNELRLFAVPAGKMRTIVKDSFAAYFWSPDGKYILYAMRKLDADHWVWTVVNVTNGKSYDVVEFFPSRPQALVFEHFDQYALSHRVWSPDSTHFVFAGSAGVDAHPAEAANDPSVYAVEAVTDATPTRLSDGHVAFWSPR